MWIYCLSDGRVVAGLNPKCNVVCCCHSSIASSFALLSPTRTVGVASPNCCAFLIGLLISGNVKKLHKVHIS